MAEIFSKKLWDHVRNPRRIGFIKDADAMAHAADPETGISVICLLQTDGKTIRDVSFLAKGCSVAIAACSVAGELVLGKSLRYAMAVDHLALSRALDGLPREKMHCAEVTVAALHAAVAEFRNPLEMPPSYLPPLPSPRKGAAPEPADSKKCIVRTNK